MGSGDSERPFERSSRTVGVVIRTYIHSLGFRGYSSHHFSLFAPSCRSNLNIFYSTSLALMSGDVRASPITRIILEKPRGYKNQNQQTKNEVQSYNPSSLLLNIINQTSQ